VCKFGSSPSSDPPENIAINIYPEACELTINAKKNHDIIFFAQRCNESLVNDNDEWQYNGTTLCHLPFFV
jgi:hypothetical protein